MRLSLLIVALALLLATAFAAPQDQDAVASLSKLISSLEDTLPVDSLEQIEEEDDMALGATGGGSSSGGGSSGGSSGGPVTPVTPGSGVGSGGNGSWTPPPTPPSVNVPDMLWNRFGPLTVKQADCNSAPTAAQVASWTTALNAYWGATIFMQFTSGCNAYSVNDASYTAAHPFYIEFYVSVLLPTGASVSTEDSPCNKISTLAILDLAVGASPTNGACMEQFVGQANQFAFAGVDATIVESDQTGVEVTVLVGNELSLAIDQFLRVEILCVYTPASNLIEQRFMDCPRFVYFGRKTNGSTGTKSNGSATFMFQAKNTQFYDGTTPVSVIINPNSVELISLNGAGAGMDPNMFVSNCSGAACGACGIDGANCIFQGTRQFDYSVNRQRQVFTVNVQDEDAYRTVRHPANWVPRCEPDMPQKIEVVNAGDTLANQVYYQTGSRGYYYCTYTGETRGNWAVGIHSANDLGMDYGRPETWQIWWNPSNTPTGGILRYQSYSSRQDFAGLQGPWEAVNGFPNDRAPIMVKYLESSVFKMQGCLSVSNGNQFNGYYVIEDTMANYVNLIRYRRVSNVAFEKHVIIYQTPNTSTQLTGTNPNTGKWYMSVDGDFTPYFMTTTQSGQNGVVLAKVTDMWAIGANANLVSGATVPSVEVVAFMTHWINGTTQTVRAAMTATEAAADVVAEARHNTFCPARFVPPVDYHVEQCVEATGSSNQQVNQVYRLVPPQRNADGTDVASNLTIYLGESFNAYALSSFALDTFNPNSGYYFLSYGGTQVYYTNQASTTSVGNNNMGMVQSTYQPFTTAITGVVTVMDTMCPDKYA